MIRVPVLMYHSITDRPTRDTRPHAVRPADFADQMAYLKESGHTPCTFGEVAAALRDHVHRMRMFRDQLLDLPASDGVARGFPRRPGRPGGGLHLLPPGPALPARPVVITFDDGYADFHDTALPVLERLGLPCTLFVTSGWVRDAGTNAAGRPLDQTLCWSQVREAAEHRVEIAGHSHSHPQLDQLPDHELREELRRNKALLEDQIGRPVITMAYPYGYSSARVREQVREAGYQAACAVNNAIAADRHDLLAVPRLTVGRRTTMARFRMAVESRGVPLLYLRERMLTKGYAVVRRARWNLRRFATQG